MELPSLWPDDDDEDDMFGEFAIDPDDAGLPSTTLPPAQHKEGEGGDEAVISAGITFLVVG